MAELAEGARLLSELGGKLPTRVRIPLSPPLLYMVSINKLTVDTISNPQSFATLFLP